jgi:hypothetical protein
MGLGAGREIIKAMQEHEFIAQVQEKAHAVLRILGVNADDLKTLKTNQVSQSSGIS